MTENGNVAKELTQHQLKEDFMRRKRTWLRGFGLLMMALMITMGATGCGREAPGSLSVKGQKEADYPDMAKVTLVDAVKRAQEKLAGKPIQAKLAADNGYLVYEVEIVIGDKSVHVVDVDAGNGAVLEVEKHWF
jgi:uncharacterized membrane protein YkoI